ncbi:sensor histidine kinase [Nocardioides nitrophenolicus]|uniref:sensor histidine kinase n=1 Tax=Nocardioides nitrophenolicus TaxID=60489 RepID=UPI00195EEB87|nr:histidine kinase [Nocardioides nitrophenolicus]MBM7517671.1 signal transduction histidine kinase [Nocardioides nitrophenolicus]
MKRAERWLPDLLAAAAVVALALVEVKGSAEADPWPPLLVLAGVALAVGLCRRLPGAALVVAWGTGLVQLWLGVDPMLTEVVLAAVAFGCARWGSLPTVWLSGFSIPVSVGLAVLITSPYSFYQALDVLGINRIAVETYRSGGYDWRIVAGLIGFALMATPWLLGLALRFAARSQDSRRSQVAAEAQRDQAEEIARLREEQAQLARDVHDVVGHSLAVILAQAESAQYLEDADTQGLKTTMANIAGSARSSLEDVRQVLASTSESQAGAVQHTDLDSLVDGVRASGHEVLTTEVGTPQPMPPELAVVAFRVLQEMLTNAIKHGRRDQPVHVERHWEGDLRIEVRNAVLPGDVPPGGGQGLDGMRRRLEAVGGHLDVRRRAEPPTFTATAWVPVRNR